MAKYFVIFVLLACVALESSSIHNRLFAKSEYSKNPHHHLRYKKHASIETNDHNAHHNHRQHHHRHNHHHHHHPHHHNQKQDEEYPVNFDQQVVEDLLPFHNDNGYNSNEKWDVLNESYKPNLWHILHSELSRNTRNKAEEFIRHFSENISSERSNSDEVDMLKDGHFGGDVDNNLNTEVDGHELHESQASSSSSAPTIKCPKCESDRQNVRVSEEELTRLRIEFVKRQILEKLRLKDKPNISASGMPKPIYEETTIQQDEPTSSKDLDDYYARASKKFIFLEREKHECHHLSQPSICFSFKINDLDAESIDVSTAVLWIFKKRNRKDILKQTIVVSEVEQGGHNSKYLPKVKPIAIQSVDVQEGWMKIDIEWPIKRWFGIHDLSHLIHISCQSCEIDTVDLISTEKDYRPFIMIDTQNRRRVSRQKRSVNCTNGVTECCREKLYISFDEIGWDDWIIRPRGYDAYFCRGSCSTVASIAQSTTHHSSIMRKVITHRDTNNKKPLELIPCCTANQYSSLEIFFRDSNNTAALMKFPNMVIESCGCM